MSDKRITDKDYLYLSTMLRARENSLLTAERLARVTEAASYDDAARLLTDCGYPDLSGDGFFGLEAALSERRAEVYTELTRLSPEPEVVEIFRLKYDYHNIKALLKARASGAATDGILSVSGRLAPAKLKEAIDSEDYRALPARMKEACVEAAGILARTENPQLADMVVDKTCYLEMLSLAEKCYSPFPKEYVRVQIDCANLRIAVRTLKMRKDVDFMRLALIPGGSIGAERLAACAYAGEGLAAPFAMTPLEKAAELGSAAAEGGSMSGFERACDNALTAFLGKVKLTGFGAEQVVAYLASLETELVAVRMVLTAKRSGMDAATLKGRLRDTYV